MFLCAISQQSTQRSSANLVVDPLSGFTVQCSIISLRSHRVRQYKNGRIRSAVWMVARAHIDGRLHLTTTTAIYSLGPAAALQKFFKPLAEGVNMSQVQRTEVCKKVLIYVRVVAFTVANAVEHSL